MSHVFPVLIWTALKLCRRLAELVHMNDILTGLNLEFEQASCVISCYLLSTCSIALWSTIFTDTLAACSTYFFYKLKKTNVTKATMIIITSISIAVIVIAMDFCFCFSTFLHKKLRQVTTHLELEYVLMFISATVSVHAHGQGVRSPLKNN